MSSAEGCQLAAAGLAEIARITALKTTAQTQQQKLALMGELAAWLSSLPAAWGNQNCANATPELVGLFLVAEWAPKHGRTQQPDGSLGPAPNSLRNAISHLSTGFEQRGRQSAWGTGSMESCNPCDSELIESYRTGYRKMLSEHGYFATGAVPFSEAKVTLLLTKLYQEALDGYNVAAPSAPTTMQLLAARDGLAFAYAWSAASRSINSRELRIQNFPLQRTDQPLRELLVPHMLLAPGAMVSITPDHLRKRGPDRNHLSTTFEVPSSADCAAYLLSPVSWLYIVLLLDRHSQVPISGLLVRPLVHHRSTEFKEVPLGKTSLQDRLDRVLIAVGAHEGETLHSFRRGQAVAHKLAGSTPESIQQKLLLASTRLVSTYSAPNRHNPHKRKAF